jgi:hypothetical protein
MPRYCRGSWKAFAAPPRRSSPATQEPVNQRLFGLRFVGLRDCLKTFYMFQEVNFESIHFCVGERRPVLAEGNTFQQIVACEQIADNHESCPRFCDYYARLAAPQPQELAIYGFYRGLAPHIGLPP